MEATAKVRYLRTAPRKARLVVDAVRGKTVSEALSDAISQCFTLGMLFRDRFVYLVLGSENKYERELQSQVKLLKNLVDPGRYQELRAQYQ